MKMMEVISDRLQLVIEAITDGHQSTIYFLYACLLVFFHVYVILSTFTTYEADMDGH